MKHKLKKKLRKNLEDDFWDGIKYDYPLCCVDFFINFWNYVRSNHIMFHGRPECYDWGYGVGYVQCPECRINSVKKFRKNKFIRRN